MRLGSMARSALDGALPLWPPILATRGPGTASAGHAHHALHLVMVVEGELRVRLGTRGRARACAGLITAPDVPHAIDGAGREVVLVFFDPESAAGTSLAVALDGPVGWLDGGGRDRLLDGFDARAVMGPDGAAFVERLIQVAGAAPVPRSAMHPKVRRTLRLLRSLDAHDLPSLETLAAQVGLSPGRLMHAFTASVGIPLRPYWLWLKLQRAAAAISAGRQLAEAAHAAGFADAAHMSRSFRRMFGVTPSALRPTT